MMEDQIFLLIQKLESLSTLVWAAAVRQAYIEAWHKLFWVSILLVIGTIAASKIKYLVNRANSSRADEGGGWAFLAILVVVASFIIFFVTIQESRYIVTGFFNPEWRAIDLLIDKVK